MKPRILTTCLIAAITLTGTAAGADDIKKEKQFLKEVSARKLTMGHSWVKISPLGSISGQGPKGGKITGEWVWNKKYYCRSMVIGGVPLPQDCQAVSVRGNVVTFTHDKGRGVPVSWIIE